MSFISMAKSLQGEVPGVPLALAKAKLNEALERIYKETTWSFQTKTGAWLAPAAITGGTATVAPFSDQVIADAAATALWLPLTTLGAHPFLTTLQFRNPAYSLYNIVAFDPAVNAPFLTITLDRPWMEPVSGQQSYLLYQAYFPVPVQDFVTFCEIRDTTNGAPVSFTKLSQDDLASIDPQRLQFGPCVPTYAVPFGVDDRAGSATLGFLLYELWPHVLANMPYTFSYKRRGSLLSANQDTLVYPLTEALAMWRAKEVLYQYKEAQRGEQVERGSGADFRFLAQSAAAEFKEELKRVRALDSNLHRDFLTRGSHPETGQNSDGFSNNITGSLNIGRF